MSADQTKEEENTKTPKVTKNDQKSVVVDIQSTS
jgi:hypothetical protein